MAISFSKNLKRKFAGEIKRSENFCCNIKLGIGKCNFVELPEVAESLFMAIEILCRERGLFIRNNKGFIRRFFIFYDAVTDMYEPCFILLLLSNKSRKAGVYKLLLNFYIRWLSVWCRLLNKNFTKKFSENFVKVEPLENEKAEEIINEFFDKPTIDENGMIDEEAAKMILKNHNIVSLTGNFLNIKRRYLSAVER